MITALAEPAVKGDFSADPGVSPTPLRAFARQAGRFAVIGSTGTGITVLLFALFGQWMDPLVANAAAWLVTTLIINELQRHFAFGVTDPTRAPLDHTVALLSSLVSLLATSVALSALTNANPAQQLTSLIAVNAVVGAARFLAIRWWLRPSSR